MPEDLLEYRLGQGWGPLCDLFGKPVPDVPIPHVNDDAHNAQIFRKGRLDGSERHRTKRGVGFMVCRCPGGGDFLLWMMALSRPRMYLTYDVQALLLTTEGMPAEKCGEVEGS